LSKNLFVGNIPYASTADDLRGWFSDFGTVSQARVATDRLTGHGRGFGFVQMADGGENAISALNGFWLEGRPLIVNEDRPRQLRRGGRSR
jgi:RNA recognition motif-containing protein